MDGRGWREAALASRDLSGLPRTRLETLLDSTPAPGMLHLLEGEALSWPCSSPPEEGTGEGASPPRCLPLLLARGVLEARRGDALLHLAQEGDLVGLETLTRAEPFPLTWRAMEDCVLHPLPPALARALQEEEDPRLRRLTAAWLERHAALAEGDGGRDPFLALRVDAVDLTPPLAVAETDSAAEAARRMAEAGASCCLVLRQGAAAGIVTERDVVAKVVAAGRDAATVPAGEIMTAPLLTARRDELLFEAFTRMVGASVRRLVVVDEAGMPAGLLGERDMLSAKGENPLYLARRIMAAATLEELAGRGRALDRLAARSLAEGLSAPAVGRLMAEMRDRVMIRAVQLVRAELPPSPAAFAVAVLGSEGRKEQFLGADQDNALIWTMADPDGTGEVPEEATRRWMRDFGNRLAQALLAVGFPPCPHRVMVDNPDWAMSLADWMNAVDDMIATADASAVLRLSLLADLRPLAPDLARDGDAALWETLRGYLLRRLSASPFLLKYMAREAVRFSPPLGLFNNLLVEKSGERKGMLDIKKGGLFPIVQGVKTLALDHGVRATSTSERLRGLVGLQALSESLASSVEEAFARLASLRARFQAESLSRGRSPGNHVDPRRLSPRERESLRDAFKVVGELQGILFKKYGLQMLV